MTAGAVQTLLTICAPVRKGADLDQLETLIAKDGNPASDEGVAARCLHKTSIVHFASLSLLDLAEPNAPPDLVILLEVNADGDKTSAIQTLAREAVDWLGPIFEFSDRRPWESLDRLMMRHCLALHTWPIGAIGLAFQGVGEFSVRDIAAQRDLAAFVRDALDHFHHERRGQDVSAMQALTFVRRLIRSPGPAASGAAQPTPLDELRLRGQAFADFLLRGNGQTYAFAQWTQPTKFTTFVRWLTSPPMRVVWGILLAIGAAIDIAILRALPNISETHSAVSMIWRPPAYVLLGLGYVARFLLFLAPAFGGVLLVTVLLGGLFLHLLRLGEERNTPDPSTAGLDVMRRINAVENPPNYAQNHFMAVTTLTPGLFTFLRLSLALYGIAVVLKYHFRPGFVLTMGTIHFAKWFRVPGARKMVFQANYDGSWESYLEDFITKAHTGQTAAWSNSVGFPRTRFLIGEGAQDGDRFKRWVRRQQVLAPFWYSRFPDLTTDQIRDNALVHDGLMRAQSETAARAWLDCLGSRQRPAGTIESGEVQSITLRGFKYHSHTVCAVLRLPDDPLVRQSWLQQVAQNPALAITFGETPPSARVHPGLGTDGDRDMVAGATATFVGFTAAGLSRCGLDAGGRDTGLASFSSAFNIGMAGRARILNDIGESAPQGWEFGDAPLVKDRVEIRPAADLALLIYGFSHTQCRGVLEAHLRELPGHQILSAVWSGPHQGAKGRALNEPFGFRDGISQPVINGTQRAAKGAPARDLVEPGEFIFGYPNNQAYYAPSPVVSAQTDPEDHLPTNAAEAPAPFPDFAARPLPEDLRDFGRNGSFMVLRKLRQNVEAFSAFTEDKARELNDIPGFALMNGGRVSADWVAAKMVGRHRDGAPLVESAGASPSGSSQDLNDFDFGSTDPQGLQCPLGAHIRRANPRTSLQPNDPNQQMITNRHRLLRRGRAYDIAATSEDGKPEVGLLFVGICADLERQFEFIQQTWVDSPAFHGLEHEPDPVVGKAEGTTSRVFTIPTPAGPLKLKGMGNFVTVRGGGYFFLPSRAALAYLATL